MLKHKKKGIAVAMSFDVQREGDGLGDKATRKDTELSTKTTPTEQTFSSRIVFPLTEEEEIADGIDQMVHLFTGFERKQPTLEESMTSMGYKKAKELTELFMKKAKERLTEIDAPGLTVNDVAAIFCYTYELGEEAPSNIESPYRVLNNSLTVSRRSASIKKVRGFLFLLLQALRKLPRFTPESHALYRGISVYIQTEFDPKFPKRLPYGAGNTKTWWGLTSTTTSLEVIQLFIKEDKGTLFVLSGSAWGYDLSLFSNFPDELEVLLEPERKLNIKNVSAKGSLITVNAEIQNSPLILENLIKVPKVVKQIKEIKSKAALAIKNLKKDDATWNSIKLSWTPVVLKKRTVTYQVMIKKPGFFNRSTNIIYDGTEAQHTAEGLEYLTKYDFRVRCGCNDMWGDWTEIFEAETTFPAPQNFLAKPDSYSTIALSWEHISTKGTTYIVKSDKDELYKGQDTTCIVNNLKTGTEYQFWVCAGSDNSWSNWEGPLVASTPQITWKKCTDDIQENRRYSVAPDNPKIIKKVGNEWCTAISRAPLGANTITTWNLKVLRSSRNGDLTYVGVAPFDIDQNVDYNKKNCGWYLHCLYASLRSGPPHNEVHTSYGPDKGTGKYVRTGSNVGVVMDTTKGELSFAVDGVNYGVAYKGIPLDKPLVPCVLLGWKGDSVEIM